ncbi:MAG: hypothetical protein HDR22_00980 [Lachnospiraceae bacterium]|nr:hypothetical protein [Lachnospiraceae bacterium]
MDSKLKKQVILAVTAIMVCVVGVVFVVNYFATGSFLPKGLQKNKDRQAETEETEELLQGDASIYKEYDLNPKKDPYAFLADPDFFDEEITSEETEFEKKSRELSLLVNSVEKDLRVTVIDGNNQLVAGRGFRILLEALEGDTVKESIYYKDLDKDGLIYVGDMKAGDYRVSLEEMDDFTMPDTVSIHVKEQIEYRLIEDISYMIKSEDEVDASIEDTEVQGALADADSTETVEHLKRENAGFGIDVSKWNKEIDWKKVKAAGVDFVIIRCGYRGSSTGALVEDPYFRKNIEGATREGIKVGIYFFTQAVNTVEAVEEASMVLTLCKGYELAFPIFIDTEGAGGKGRADELDREIRTQVCKAFCETIENSGFNAGVYASRSWFVSNVDASVLESHYIWLAQYRRTPTYAGSYDLWQYTSSGSVDGIDGRVDLNISYVGF